MIPPPAGSPILIEAALNGGRAKRDNPAVPYSPAELATAASACAAAGAAVLHLHARGDDGGWTADPARYATTILAVRDAAPDSLVSITSLRPADAPLSVLLDLLSHLGATPNATPDLISINLGHVTVWERATPPTAGRRTLHYPNSYDDIAALLRHCTDLGIVPELGIMDTGFISNAVALDQDGLLPDDPWFLLELDSPAWGAGPQVAPATAANFHHLRQALASTFPHSSLAAHGTGRAWSLITDLAIASGNHLRVGFEDALHLPDGTLAASNQALVAWAAHRATAAGRTPITPDAARALLRVRQ